MRCVVGIQVVMLEGQH